MNGSLFQIYVQAEDSFFGLKDSKNFLFFYFSPTSFNQITYAHSLLYTCHSLISGWTCPSLLKSYSTTSLKQYPWERKKYHFWKLITLERFIYYYSLPHETETFYYYRDVIILERFYCIYMSPSPFFPPNSKANALFRLMRK